MKGARFNRDDERILYHSLLDDIKQWIDKGADALWIEETWPRESIF